MVHSFRIYIRWFFSCTSCHSIFSIFGTKKMTTLVIKNEITKYTPNPIHSNLWVRPRKSYDEIIKFFIKLNETLSCSSWTKVYATHQCCHSDGARKENTIKLILGDARLNYEYEFWFCTFFLAAMAIWLANSRTYTEFPNTTCSCHKLWINCSESYSSGEKSHSNIWRH